jgi:hypothetical protein
VDLEIVDYDENNAASIVSLVILGPSLLLNPDKLFPSGEELLIYPKSEWSVLYLATDY